jgi:hypothetical protein
MSTSRWADETTPSDRQSEGDGKDPFVPKVRRKKNGETGRTKEALEIRRNIT